MVQRAEFTFKGAGHPFYSHGDRLVLQVVDQGKLLVKRPDAKYPDALAPDLLKPCNEAARRAITSARATRRAA